MVKFFRKKTILLSFCLTLFNLPLVTATMMAVDTSKHRYSFMFLLDFLILESWYLKSFCSVFFSCPQSTDACYTTCTIIYILGSGYDIMFFNLMTRKSIKSFVNDMLLAVVNWKWNELISMTIWSRADFTFAFLLTIYLFYK